MTSYAGLRALVGEKKFDRMVRDLKAANKHVGAMPIGLASMSAEPENSGLSIPEGRKALKKAAKHSFKLPEVGSST